ncbi:MAG: putative Ig domain-containing protein [Thermoplasmatota archaeon]
MLKRALVIILIVMVSGMISMISYSEETSGGAPTRGNGHYLLCPFVDVLTIREDEEYNSKYWTVGGPINVNSFTTDSDWLTWEFSDPLEIATTDNEAYWSFDQGDAADDSGNLHHGRVTGAIATTGVSLTSGALSFDGDGDFVEVPYHSNFNISDEITVDAWIYPTFTDSGEHMIISKGGSWDFDDSQDYELTMDKDRPLFQIKEKDTDEWYGAAPADPIEKNRWTHVAGVYDGSNFKIFIDGIEPSSYFDGWDVNYKGSAYPGGLPRANHPVYIGRRAEASWGSLWYKGKIDDARIWDRALTTNEILRLASIPGRSCINLTGTPDNSDVGQTQVTLNVTDNNGRYDQHSFIVTVQNDPPEILTDNVVSVMQDEYYEVDYDSSDDGEGDIEWSMTPNNIGWLSLNSTTGVLSGTPLNGHVKKYNMNITVDDGNGGRDYSEFQLEVVDVNDYPVITGEDIISIDQDEDYFITYDAVDIDDETLIWNYHSNASWLAWSPYLKRLSGKPGNDDVGVYFVNITVSDQRGGSDTRNFTVTVNNINDPIEWTAFPKNVTVNEGDHYHFDVNATDIDPGQTIEYSIETSPITNITIDPATGEIDWYVSSEPFTLYPYVLIVNVTATDGILPKTKTFTLDVIENYKPVTHLQTPFNETVLSGTSVTLNWTGADADSDELSYDVYMSTEFNEVITLDDKALFTSGMEENTLMVDGLVPGEVYHWTVIPFDSFGGGLCKSGIYWFEVNIPPVSSLISPPDEVTTRSYDIVFEWEEITGEPKTYDFTLYAGTNETNIIDLEGDAILYGPGNETEFILNDPIHGVTYYWTVMVSDGISTGICSSGIRSFYVNSPPTLDPISNVKVTAGEQVTIDLNGSDPENSAGFGYDLLRGPGNLTINAETSTVTWIPTLDQVGTHMVTVGVHDDLESINITFQIQVMEPEPEEDDDSGSPMILILLIAIPILLILLILVIVVILVIAAKKGKKEEETEEEPEPVVEQGKIYTTAWTPPPEVTSGPIEGVSPDEVTENEFIGGTPAESQPVADPSVEPVFGESIVTVDQTKQVVDVDSLSQITIEQPAPSPAPEPEAPPRAEGDSLVDDLF